jgi:hypothetical protein
MNTQVFLNSSFDTETQMTTLCFRWINANYPQLRGLFFHVPNENFVFSGENRSNSNWKNSLRLGMGVTPGIPDFLCVRPLFAVELKKGSKGKLSDQQKNILDKWSNFMNVYVCTSLQQFHDIIVKECGYGTGK